ncbi:unnamed protein product [Acanthoscelides obtectus]|uniref:Uncharacterized protein n=1 Tax=Acanthoscelides obtectus TaxID=200917 RepID=A0A9P0QDQ2_ACAOB|nr:unnamed protein product [Acanthoscelides obtectus]CAK1684321.1 hypothetical protein AOBTE_LOCUS34804 [Acanthoscelides obtectus]
MCRMCIPRYLTAATLTANCPATRTRL